MKPIILGSLLLGSALASPRRIPKGIDSSHPLLEARATTQTPKSINLGDASRFAVFGFTGIATVPGTSDQIITGDIGVAPIAITAITGFGAVTNGQTDQPYVSGGIYGPVAGAEAHDDILAAYTVGSAPYPNSQDMTGMDLDGLTLSPGVYRWNSALTLNVGTTLSLAGDCGDIFLFQATGAITTGTGSNVQFVSSGSGAPTLTSSTVYWIGATSLVTGVDSTFAGIILTYTNVVIAGILDGAVYSQTEVALHGATITVPSTSDVCQYQNAPKLIAASSTCTGDHYFDQAVQHCYLCPEFTWNTGVKCRGCSNGQYFIENSKGECHDCLDENAATCAPITGVTTSCIAGTILDSKGVCVNYDNSV